MNNYWNFTAGTIFVLWVLYIGGKGEIAQWSQVLLYSPAPVPKVSSSGTTPAQPPEGVAQGNAPVQAPGESAVPNWMTQPFGSIFKGSK